MHNDINRLIKESNGEKIITKHEWMIAALEVIEKDIVIKRDETPQMLYEALLIDPSKLTPY
jgi:hypothetical protein